MKTKAFFRLGLLALIIVGLAAGSACAEEGGQETFEKAVKLMADGKLDEARTELDRVINAHPDFLIAYGMRSEIFFGKNDPDGAIRDLSKMLETAKDPVILEQAYANRGFGYFLKKEYARSIEDSGKALEINPADAMALYNRGLAYYSSGDYGKALADYEKASSLLPDDEGAYKDLAKYIPARNPSDTADVRSKILRLFKQRSA